MSIIWGLGVFNSRGRRDLHTLKSSPKEKKVSQAPKRGDANGQVEIRHRAHAQEAQPSTLDSDYGRLVCLSWT